jgi:hypothetical protein
MDREAWKVLKASVKKVCRSFKFHGRKRPYSFELILLMYFWIVSHRRPLYKACRRDTYGDLFRPRKLPGVSQFCRRVKEPVFQELLLAVHTDLIGGGHASPVKVIDGKPLLVSPVSNDPDARRGHVTGGFGKGYRLHAVVTEKRRVLVWSVTPLNVAEQTVALELAGHLKPAAAGPRSLVLADSNYDSAPLHKALDQSDHRLLTPLKAQQRVKDGKHHPVTLRQMGPQRRQAVAVWDEHADLARYVLKDRVRVENLFSAITMALDAGSPPPWVRRLDRVRRWAGAVVILHNLRQHVREQRARSTAA